VAPTSEGAMPNKPNLILIVTDQMRGDCLGAAGHPVVHTPHLDRLAARGTRFTAAYSSCPSCIAARASLFTGLRPTTHGRLGYQDQVPWRYTHTLAEELASGGYQTHCIGKTHFFPQKLPLGFESQESYEAAQDFSTPDHPYVNDYYVWLSERTGVCETDHGLDWNSWKPGVSVLPEPWHNNSWVVERGLAFLQHRDRQRPLFLNLSFHRPHAPLDPPSEFFERYRNTPIPPVPVGDWASTHDLPVTNPNAWHGRLPAPILADARRAYYAQISHIDHVIGRFIESYERWVPEPTWWIFTADHGEMLGDHHLFRKTYGYEGSARIPFLVIPPAGVRNPVSHAPVLLEDIMPTLLEAAGLPCPSRVEGRSVLPLLSDPAAPWRPYLHGEHSACYDPHTGIQYLTDGRIKYIWHTFSGREELFDLTQDRDELHNLAGDFLHRDLLKFWHDRMISELAPRTQDGLSTGKRLVSGISLPHVRPDLLE
jgi:arylsulfatase